MDSKPQQQVSKVFDEKQYLNKILAYLKNLETNLDFICEICQSKMTDKNYPCNLHCGHVICLNCNDTIAKQKYFCPFCKKTISPNSIQKNYYLLDQINRNFKIVGNCLNSIKIEEINEKKTRNICCFNSHPVRWLNLQKEECYQCRKEDKAIIGCVECNCYFCFSCLYNNGDVDLDMFKFTCFNDHKSMTYDELPSKCLNPACKAQNLCTKGFNGFGFVCRDCKGFNICSNCVDMDFSTKNCPNHKFNRLKWVRAEKDDYGNYKRSRCVRCLLDDSIYGFKCESCFYYICCNFYDSKCLNLKPNEEIKEDSLPALYSSKKKQLRHTSKYLNVGNFEGYYREFNNNIEEAFGDPDFDY